MKRKLFGMCLVLLSGCVTNPGRGGVPDTGNLLLLIAGTIAAGFLIFLGLIQVLRD